MKGRDSSSLADATGGGPHRSSPLSSPGPSSPSSSAMPAASHSSHSSQPGFPQASSPSSLSSDSSLSVSNHVSPPSDQSHLPNGLHVPSPSSSSSSSSSSVSSTHHAAVVTPAEIMRQASFLSSRDKHQEALAVYTAGLRLFPRDTNLWNCKGVVLRALGRTDEALACCREALLADPTNGNASNNIGVILKERGDLTGAIHHYKEALKCHPEHTTCRANLAVALTDLGTKLKQEKNLEQALQRYLEALTADPTYAPGYYNLGVLHAENGDVTTALKMYDQALQFNPRYVEAYNNIGAIYKNLGKLKEAIAYYEKALSYNPSYQMSQSNLAVALTDLGTQLKSIEGARKGVSLYKKALLYNPFYADAYYNLGVAYAELMKYDRALVNYQLATAFNPNCAEAYNNMGVIYKDRENPDQAIACYKKALAIRPDFAQTLNNLGVLYTCTGKMSEALRYAIKAIEVCPDYAEAYNNLGVLYRDEGEISLSIQAYDRCLALDPLSPNAFHNKLLAMNYLEELREDEIFRVSEEWGDAFLSRRKQYTSWLCPPIEIRPRNQEVTPHSFQSNSIHALSTSSSSIVSSSVTLSSSPATTTSTASRVIRVGYIGPDFFTHSVSYFIHTPLMYHDASRFHVTVYANVVREDDKTQMFKTLPSKWKSITGMPDGEVAKMIRDEDQIDILVELAGHTAHNRLDVLAYKPAPIQVTWIGYPNTTGLKTVDFRISDSIADPPDTLQRFTEELARLPQCFVNYQPPPLPLDTLVVSLPPVLENGFITFGSFNNLAKLGKQAFHVWSSVLRALPTSRLLVKARPFADAEMRKKFVKKFERQGISSDRIDTMALIPSCADHLMVYCLVDIALDSFPYAGTTTTCEALLMGVPVLSLRRQHCHATNVGATLLQYYGFPELIADTPEDYVHRAVELAGDVARLKKYRQSIRAAILERASKSRAEEFTRDLEDMYCQMILKKKDRFSHV
ncbi:putative udp-n-acetylglucosamine--peptide n-acetylglucosaminyltransferase spindly [Cystoisospora suis]|uniref:Probable UDP-N-acetylglucosamine--peptide N-acetylglucosaminyltransferase SPINDLY n=1 Tax=Cystoisospora suis TaxID=483139 RepID=A0A2C6L3S0_9APIC|nr:putative udp-n-acetylglucosamine--peptide n-acetylglucosaminyltransferase spindly [Cystoisospora suis]